MSEIPPNHLFTLAVHHTLRLEGGDVDDPDDHGGRTRFGISQAAYPDIDMSRLTEEQAIALYRRDYWSARHCNDLPARWAVYVFDAAINHQYGVAEKLLQRALGVRADGIIGPATVAAAATQALDDNRLARAFAYRCDLYQAIVQADTRQARFLEGWFFRLFSLQQFILGPDLLEA